MQALEWNVPLAYNSQVFNGRQPELWLTCHHLIGRQLAVRSVGSHAMAGGTPHGGHPGFNSGHLLKVLVAAGFSIQVLLHQVPLLQAHIW